MMEIKKIDENSCLGAFENIVYNGKYRDYEIFIVEKNLRMPFYIPDFTDKSSWYNGYIIIPTDSKYYGMDYDDISCEISVHGGFTYGKYVRNEYVIGFDTAHDYDDKNTQNVNFVFKELQNAVDQIIEQEKEFKNFREWGNVDVN